MTERIDHATEALRLADLSQHPNTGDPAVGALYIGAAQIHATLALVEQQRIANLIAMSQPQPFKNGGTIALWVFNPETGALRADVSEGLGLEQSEAFVATPVYSGEASA
ncbi:hypothetical protein CSIV_05080 [Microbacterium sp. CSI-V]|uniref:hypothetical protein n=1 Tax=Microbacterium sp. CSI-V TaxID=1933777 RepID=UPI00097BED70|nr:hypothetical protein [Microbacterium sp. CSI-V]ONI65653.1 hypothetical protein CSIV_05080 [Microbacterium sp. CSI-V]